MRRIHLTIALSLVAGHLAAVEPADAERITVRRSPLGPATLVIRAPRVDPASEEIQRKLQLPVTFTFAEVSLPEAVTFICRSAGVNVVIDPALRADMAVPPITLAVTDMTAANALDWVLLQADVRRTILHGAVYISRRPVSGPMALHFVDVSDIATPIRHFPGPRLALTSPDNGNFGGLIFGPPEDVPAEAEATWDVDDLARLLEDHLNDDR